MGQIGMRLAKNAFHKMICMAGIMAGIVLFACYLAALPFGVSLAADAPTTAWFAITKVTDGDSLRAGDIRIRLHGIDAPEMRQMCEKQGVSYGCGIDARTFLADRLPIGTEVKCDHIDTDRYNRLVMRCYHRGIDISAAMVQAGWAVAYRRYAKDYVADEIFAKNQQNGLWAGTFQMPWDWRKKK